MKITRNSFLRLLLLLLVGVLPAVSVAADDLDGLWYGEARIEGE